MLFKNVFCFVDVLFDGKVYCLIVLHYVGGDNSKSTVIKYLHSIKIDVCELVLITNLMHNSFIL
jgi:hypothetical protein